MDQRSGDGRFIGLIKIDAPEARHGTLPKTYTSPKKRTRLHSSHPRKNGYCRLPQQNSQKKDSVW